MSLSGPSNIIFDEDFISLLFHDNEIEDVFWQLFEPTLFDPVNVSLGGWGPLLPTPKWTALYSVSAMQEKLKNISKQVEFIGLFFHALGIAGSFRKDPLRQVTPIMERILLEKFPQTIVSLIKAHDPQSSLAIGYHNVAFQNSLLSALKDFQKVAHDPLKILDPTIASLEESISYYHFLTPEERFSIIRKDLQGKMRIFSTGRLNDFHATNIVLSAKYIAFCDRFDVDPFFKKDWILQPTGRDHQHGVYVYALPKPFAQLPKETQDQLIRFLTESISKEDTLLGLKKLLGLSDKPLATLFAKRQKRGTCRYASKKQGIAGAMLIAALEQVEEGQLSAHAIQRITKEVHHLQKVFKLYDRAHKIHALINHEEINPAQKDHLLLMALFRMKSNNKKPLIDEIISYFKQRVLLSPRLSSLLYEILDELARNLDREDYRKYVVPMKQRLQAEGVKLIPEAAPHYGPLSKASPLSRVTPYSQRMARKGAAKKS